MPPVNGDVVVGAGKKYIGSSKDLVLPGETAWFKIESSQTLNGFELFGSRNGMMLDGLPGMQGSYRIKRFSPRPQQIPGPLALFLLLLLTAAPGIAKILFFVFIIGETFESFLAGLYFPSQFDIC